MRILSWVHVCNCVQPFLSSSCNPSEYNPQNNTILQLHSYNKDKPAGQLQHAVVIEQVDSYILILTMYTQSFTDGRSCDTIQI